MQPQSLPRIQNWNDLELMLLTVNFVIGIFDLRNGQRSSEPRVEGVSVISRAVGGFKQREEVT